MVTVFCSLFAVLTGKFHVDCRMVCVFLFAVDVKEAAEVEPSPVWVPDASAPVCMVCKKTAFTLVNRRVCVLTEQS